MVALQSPPVNPPFDARMLSIGSPLSKSASLARGMILEDLQGKPGQRQHGCRFLFNPTELDVSHSVNTAFLPTDQGNVGDPTSPIGNPGASLSFSLLFDRTYELWDSSQAKTRAGQRGVYVDVLALYYLCKIVDEGTVSTDNNGNFETLDNILKPMQPTLAYFYFGAPGRSLSYYGFINQLGITYSHWASSMVPQRCVVNINVTIMPKDATAGNAGSLANPNATNPSAPTGPPQQRKLQLLS